MKDYLNASRNEVEEIDDDIVAVDAAAQIGQIERILVEAGDGGGQGLIEVAVGGVAAAIGGTGGKKPAERIVEAAARIDRPGRLGVRARPETEISVGRVKHQTRFPSLM